MDRDLMLEPKFKKGDKVMLAGGTVHRNQFGTVIQVEKLRSDEEEYNYTIDLKWHEPFEEEWLEVRESMLVPATPLAEGLYASRRKKK